MQTTYRSIPGSSIFKTPEAFICEAGAEREEENGGRRSSTHEQRWRIISAYLRVLEDMKGPIAADCELPCPKELIRQAILLELADDPESDLRRRMEIAYVLLESFIPHEEYRVIEDFKDASLRAQGLAGMGDPTSILRSAQMISTAKGESAVRLQEEIYERMKLRHYQILQLREISAA